MASQTVPIRSGVCRQCGARYEPYLRRREAQRFCCASCREKAWKASQRSLPLEPAPAGWTPAQREQSAHMHKRESRKARMLARLQQGEATTWELMQLGGSGWRSRLRELREDGHNIPPPENRLDYAIYRLEAKP